MKERKEKEDYDSLLYAVFYFIGHIYSIHGRPLVDLVERVAFWGQGRDKFKSSVDGRYCGMREEPRACPKSSYFGGTGGGGEFLE